jgi:hypothetical protein
MKQTTKWLAVGLAVAGGLAFAGALRAQSVVSLPSMDPTTLNTSPNALYANWDGGATFTSSSSGLEVQSSGYGSLYYVVPAGQVQTLSANDTEATLVFTVNGTAANYVWIGTPFILNDNSGATTYTVYSGSGNPGNPVGTTWNGNTVTETVQLSSAQLAAVQAGNDAIYGFNLEVAPATFGGGQTTYDITFNSLTLSPVPEPSTMALAGLGMAGLLAIRRRK